MIPARGGSKGIPLKNLAKVGGRSLVRRAVDAALAAVHVDTVVVSTDDPAIADEATSTGALVIRRPDELSGDTASSESAVLHALDEIGGHPRVAVLVQATSPFVWPDDIDSLVAAVTDGDADCALTVCASHGFLWRRGPGGAEGVNHGVVPRQRRQELDSQFLETGGGYAMRVDGLRASGNRFFGRIEMVEVPAERSIEIDEPSDLEIARDIAWRLDRPWWRSRLPSPVGAVVFDFDGVMTDNRVTTDQHGVESVVASRSDGMGIELLREAGVPMVVISKERNPVTAARCAKLRIEAVHGIDDKVGAMTAWLERRAIDPASVIYVGNDVNDLGCMQLVGCPIAVADAHPTVLASASLVLPRAGGRGAVRELADAIVELR